MGQRALVLHAATSTTNPCIYITVMTETVHPYWVNNPPPANARLTTKPYKSMDHPTAILPENSLTFKVCYKLSCISMHQLSFRAGRGFHPDSVC